MLILGIDPGLQRTGFGVIQVDGPRLAYVASGTISTLELPRGDLPGRLKIIFEGVQEVVQRYAPDCACAEIVFVNVNPQSTLLLGQARGAALAALVSGGLPVAGVVQRDVELALDALLYVPRRLAVADDEQARGLVHCSAISRRFSV